MNKILVTGATGMVGQYISGHLGPVQLLTPTHEQMDITDKNSVNTYIAKYTPSIIIHAAAYTDNTQAELERGDRSGACWKVNVEGTKNLAKTGIYMVYLSTGSVFSGEQEGTFAEDDTPSPDSRLSWYGITKKEAEKIIQGSIIRLSHPVRKPEIVDFAPRFDYVEHLVQLFDQKKLYPLFADQMFGITYLSDVLVAIKKLLETRKQGIFHVVSYDQTSPHELASYAIWKARHVKPELPKTTFDEFIKNQKNPLRFSKYHAIDGTKTARELQLPVRTWREIVDELYEISDKR